MVTAGPRGPSFCVGTVGPIDHSPYTVPNLYRSGQQPIVGLGKGNRLETPNQTSHSAGYYGTLPEANPPLCKIHTFDILTSHCHIF